MCVCVCKQERAILIIVDKFTYLVSNISSTEIYANIQIRNPLIAIDRLSFTWKSDLSDKTGFLPSCGCFNCGNIYPTRQVPTISTSYISSWQFDRLVVPLIFGQGHFTCFTNIQ